MVSWFANRQAFSLVELSIVLVILGLLVGGILAGQSLIKASELRKVGADFTKYEAAINAFRDKYFFYPGDLPNATQFWGLAAGTAGNDVSCYDGLAAGAVPGTCDGNGDGYISQRNIPYQSMKFRSESMAGWQHLSLAGMVEGQYTGIMTLIATEPFGYVAGVNMPAAPIGRNAVYGLGPSSGGGLPPANHELMIDGRRALNVITLGKPISSNALLTFSPFGNVLTHEEAWNIDTKHDDGVSQTGKIRSRLRGPNANAAFWKREDGTGATHNGSCAVYFDDTTYRCALGWIFGPL